MFLLATALAVDAHPTLLAPAAVPLEPLHGQVDVRMVAGYTAHRNAEGFGHLARATLSFGRVSIGGMVGGSRQKQVPYQPDVLGTVMVDPLAFEHFRLRLVAGAGTVLRAGLAMWIALPSRFIEIDLGFGATFDARAFFPPRNAKVWADVDREPALEWEGLLSQAELGITVHLEPEHRLQVRFGNFAYVPNVSLRAAPPLKWIEVGIEVGGGWAMNGGGFATIAITVGRQPTRREASTTSSDAPSITGE